MNPLNSLPNQVGGLSTQAIQALTHRLCLNFPTLRERDVASVPTETLVCDPASLPAGRSYPDARLAASVNDGQRPLSLKLVNVAVGDLHFAQRIDHLDRFLLEDHFGFDPKQIDQQRENHGNEQFQEGLRSVFQDNKSVCGKKSDEHEGNSGENEVASGAESFIHPLSIAGAKA